MSPVPAEKTRRQKIAPLDLESLAVSVAQIVALHRSSLVRLEELREQLEGLLGHELEVAPVMRRAPVHVQPVAPQGAKVTRTRLQVQPAAAPAVAPPAHFTPLPEDDSDRPLGKPERALLNVLVCRAPLRVSRRDLALLSLYSIRSSHFENTLSELRGRGYIDGDAHSFGATPSGIGALEKKTGVLGPRELCDAWKRKISKAEGAILDVIVAAHPQVLTKLEIAERSGYSIASSHFENSLSELRGLQLIDKKTPVAAAVLLPPRT